MLWQILWLYWRRCPRRRENYSCRETRRWQKLLLTWSYSISRTKLWECCSASACFQSLRLLGLRFYFEISLRIWEICCISLISKAGLRVRHWDSLSPILVQIIYSLKSQGAYILNPSLRMIPISIRAIFPNYEFSETFKYSKSSEEFWITSLSPSSVNLLLLISIFAIDCRFFIVFTIDLTYWSFINKLEVLIALLTIN